MWTKYTSLARVAIGDTVKLERAPKQIGEVTRIDRVRGRVTFAQREVFWTELLVRAPS